jgi:hypothetical protein
VRARFGDRLVSSGESESGSRARGGSFLLSVADQFGMQLVVRNTVGYACCRCISSKFFQTGMDGEGDQLHRITRSPRATADSDDDNSTTRTACLRARVVAAFFLSLF